MTLPEVEALRVGAFELRAIEEEDAAPIEGLLRTLPETDYFLGELRRSYLPRHDEEGRRTKWGFLVHRDGEPVGMTLLGIGKWEALRGYTGADVFVPFRGQRVAPGTKPALFHLGFALLGLHRIETGCNASNEASRRSIERTPGLQFEGTLREYNVLPDGTFDDERRYAILRPEWEELYSDVAVEVVLRGPLERSAP
jgi:RimJ/RimL family protein N-acetyltransferase